MITKVQNSGTNFCASVKFANSIKDGAILKAFKDHKFANQIAGCNGVDVFQISRAKGENFLVEALKGGKRLGEKVECAGNAVAKSVLSLVRKYSK